MTRAQVAVVYRICPCGRVQAGAETFHIMHVHMYWVEAQAPQLVAGVGDGVSSALPAGELYPPRPIVKV